LLWIGATIGVMSLVNLTYAEYTTVLETGCSKSLRYGFGICPSATDFDANGNPYWAKQSDGSTVIYYDDSENPTIGSKHTSYDDTGYKLVNFIFAIIFQSGLIFLAYLGLNSHYKWFSVKFTSCEKGTQSYPNVEDEKK
jgi:hypothetical protein